MDPLPETSPDPISSTPTETASSTTYQPNPDRIVTIIDPATNQPLRLVLKTHKSEIEAVGRKKETFRKKTLEEIIGVETGGPQGRRANDPGHTPQMYTMFAEFIRFFFYPPLIHPHHMFSSTRSMLIYEPSERTTAVEALKHAYLHTFDQEKQEETKDEDSKPAATKSEKTEESQKAEETTLSTNPAPTNQSPPKRRLF